MAIGSAVDNASETAGDLNKEAWDKYNALRTAILVYHETSGAHKSTGDAILKALFDANTILAANSDDTPAALTVAAQRLIGRITGGSIAALTPTQIRTLLNIEDGATADQTEVEILTLLGLTSVEVDQLGAIGTSTISAAQWGYLGGLDQALAQASSPTFAGASITGFTVLGTGAPTIKMKKITSTTGAAEGGVVNFAHGVTVAKIISITCLVWVSATSAMPPEFTGYAGYQYSIYIADATNVSVVLHATNSENILSKSITVMIVYEE